MSTILNDLLTEQIEATTEALRLAHQALALSRREPGDVTPEATDLARALATLEFRLGRVRQQVGLPQVVAVH